MSVKTPKPAPDIRDTSEEVAMDRSRRRKQRGYASLMQSGAGGVSGSATTGAKKLMGE